MEIKENCHCFMAPSKHMNHIGQQIRCVELRAIVIGECKLRGDDGN